MTFDTQGSQVFVTTVQLSSLGAGTGAPGLKTLTFHEPTGKKAMPYGVVKATVADTPLSNLFSIDANGNLQPVVSSNVNVKVMYTVASPDGTLSQSGIGQSNYLYVVLDPMERDTQKVIADYNCSIFKVTIADGTFSCLDPGYIAQDAEQWRSYYAKKIGGSVKPLQFDASGNVYFLGWSFQVNNGGLDFNYRSQPTIRKVAPDGTATSITPDVLSIQSYLVTKNDTIVYSYWNNLVNTGGMKIYDLATGSTNELTPDDAASWWYDSFYLTDDKETVIFGGRPGIYFAQKSSGFTGGKYTLQLDTSLFGNRDYVSPTKVIAGDDGNLYGLFVERGQWDSTTQKTPYYLKLYQLLPYDGLAKATIDLPADDWWSATNGVEVQIRKGYAYFIEKERHPADAYSPRTFIKAVDMLTKKETKMLFGGDWTLERYDIYNWKLVGDVIHFTGFNNATSKMILGDIDTIRLIQTKSACLAETDPALKCLAIKEISSVAGASAQIQDMEAVKMVIPTIDPGDYPRATVYTDQENLYSASLKFTKYMKKDTVNAAVSIKDASSNAQNAMKVWFGQTLHLIVDTDGQMAPAKTVPLAYNTLYDIALANDDTVKDIFGWSLDCTDINLPCSKPVQTRPEVGWWQGTDVGISPTIPAGITSGAIGKLALPNGSWSGNLLTVARSATYTTFPTGQTPADDITAPDTKVEFSAKNRAGGDIRFTLKGSHPAWGISYRPEIVNINLYNGYFYISYLDNTNNWANGESYTTNGYSLPILNGQWSKYTIEIYGSIIRLTVLAESGASHVFEYTNAKPASYNWGSEIAFTDYEARLNINGYTAGDTFYFDDFSVLTLNPVTGAPTGTIFNETFTTTPFNTRLTFICNGNGDNCK